MYSPSKIFVVDDIAENRQLLASIINSVPGFKVLTANSGKSLLDVVKKEKPDLILLDIMMPEIDGLQVARKLKSREETQNIPIIFITALTDMESKIVAFENGGVDYITKPFNREELLARVGAHVRLKKLQDELTEKNEMLSDREKFLTHLVEKKTGKIEKVTIALVNALENANLFNDDDTGHHIKRVSIFSGMFAEKYGAEQDFIRKIKLYASLHDVGKVGIPDELLKKPGRYTPDERERMKKHVSIGARMLDSPEIDVMAKKIALYHHEKWDGSGYLSNLSGQDIPLEGRIVAIVDVFDALVNKRVYKEAFSIEKTDKIISEEKGKHFEPKLVDIYFEIKEEMMSCISKS